MKYQPLWVMSVILASLFLAGCTQSNGGYGGGTNSDTGRLVFAVTDAAADMGSVSSVKMTVESVSVRNANEGWTTVSTQRKTYDLIELKQESKSVVLADVDVPEGTYDQMRLDVSSVIVTDANGTHHARMPSNQLKFMGEVRVEANSTSTAHFDFIASESLHTTGKGEYVMAPVVQVETRENAMVDIASDDRVMIRGGNTRTNARYGMAADGTIAVGVRIPANAVIEIAGNGVISIAGIGGRGNGSGSLIIGITDAAANMSSITSINVTIEKVMMHSEGKGWVTVSSTQRTVDLLELSSTSSTQVIANATLDAGSYTQMRIDVSRVVVTDTNGTHEAKLPSGELKIMAETVVEENATATAVIDVIANASLHRTGRGQYIMAPVIDVEIRQNANVTSDAQGRMGVQGGTVKTRQRLGMDANGTLGVNLGIPVDSVLDVDASGKVKIGLGITVG